MLPRVSDVLPFKEALRESLGSCTLAEDGYEFVDATMTGRRVLVSFRHGDPPDVYAVELDAASPLSGASAGEMCSTVDEWAREVHWLLDEEIGTGDL